MSWHIHPDVVSRRLGDTVVLVNLTDNAIYELNRTGARTLELIASGTAFDQIVRQLASEFGADPAAIAGEVDHLVNDLLASGILNRAS